MTLFQEQSKGFYGRWLSVFAMLLVGLSFTAGTAKAAGLVYTGVNVTKENDTKYVVTVPADIDSSSSILFCSYKNFPGNGTPTLPYITNGATSQRAFYRQIASYDGLDVDYFVNPSANTNYEINFPSYYNYYGTDKPSCFVVSGVDVEGGAITTYTLPTDFDIIQTGQTYNVSSVGTTAGHSVVGIFQSGNGGATPAWQSASPVNDVYNSSDPSDSTHGPARYIGYIQNASAGSNVFSLKWLGYNTSWTGGFIEFNPAPLRPCTSFTWSDYSICSEGKQWRSLIGESPAGCYIDWINNPPGDYSRSCDYGFNSVVFPINWNGFLYSSGGSNIYQKFSYTYDPTAVASSFDTIQMYQCTDEACGSSSTVPVVFNNGFSTTTKLSIRQPFGTSAIPGSSYFQISQPSNLSTSTASSVQYRINVEYNCTTADDCELQDQQIRNIIWTPYSSSLSDVSKLQSYGLSDLLGGSLHDVACSSDDWASTNVLTHFKCITFEGGLNISNAIYVGIRSTLNFFVDTLSHLFPFNVIKNIADAWSLSATATMPTGLAVFDIVSSGGISMSIPSQWAGTASTTYPIFGTSAWSSDISVLSFFAGVRSFSTYLMLFLFAINCWLVGKHLVEVTDSGSNKIIIK